MTVVSKVLNEEQAASYVDEAYAWLESFGLGFDRHDPKTWHVKNVPAFVRLVSASERPLKRRRNGLYHRHAVGHEDWVWRIRQEPSLIKVFEQVWGTDELLVSYGT